MTEGDDGATLRPARPADAPALVALHRLALRDVGTDPADVPGTDDLREVPASYRDAGGEFLVVDDGGPVAMGGYRPADETTVEVFRMAVAPGRQGEGLGGRVLDALEADARDAGFERVTLETAERQDAAGFYAARGYEEVGRRRADEYELIRLEKGL